MTSPPHNPPNTFSSFIVDRASGASSHRPQQTAWGQQLSSRRGIAPISTTFNPNSARPLGLQNSPRNIERNPWSPVTSNASSVGTSASRQSLRSPPITSGLSPFSPPTTSQQQAQSNPLLFSRPRNIAPPTNSQLASTAAASQGTGVGGGSGGGSSKNFRASPSLLQSTFGSPTSSSSLGAPSAGQSGQVSKIIIAQIFLLLSTIKEDKDKSKWDFQADQIRKLVDQNGMEVFPKYFRRLLVTNASQIWNSGRSFESTGSYGLLVAEVHKVTQDLSQAAKIVESVEFGEGEIFKDFDLSSFMDHFKMSPLAKVTLANAFRKASKTDLRTKADAILSNNLRNLFNGIADPNGDSHEPPEEISSAFYASIVDRLAQDPPRNWTSDSQQNLFASLREKYLPTGGLIPVEISAALHEFELLSAANPLVRLIKKNGPRGTVSLETCKSMLESAELRDIDYQQVASALLFMVIAGDEPGYDTNVFVTALRQYRGGQRLDWQDVIHAFDRAELKVSKGQFKRLFDALLPVAQEDETLDIQLLWGGGWHHEETQLAFVAAFVSLSEDELDASQIPRLRKAFTLDDFADAADDVKAYAETAVRHPLVSVDATKALFNMVFRSSDTYIHAQNFGVVDNIINPKMDLFVCSVSAVAKPWSALQDQAIKQLVASFFWKAVPGRSFALHLLWKRDMPWLAQRLFQYYQAKPMQLLQILELAEEHGWMTELISANTELSLDLATVAHGRGLFDLEPWLHQIIQAMRKDRLFPALTNFLRTKAEDELKSQREDTERFVVPLTIRTVYVLLEFLGSEGLAEEESIQLQRICIQAYPRLINFGEGYDSIIEANSRDGNGLSPDADAKMQEHYKLMYSNEKQVREVVEDLQKYKKSDDPAQQDLFACMIFGLFDEYNCFGEYPLDALATTAVLFGSIINYNLLSRIALQVAISMVLEAVRDYPPDESMYKFGLQALLHFQGRLEEWLSLSKVLFQVPGLKGTPVYPLLERVLRENTSDGAKIDPEPVNGVADDFLAAEPRNQDFASLTIDPRARPDFYKEPDEKMQEDVLFILNNVSDRNLAAKLPDLKRNLLEEYLQWFADYLVESRIKPQPNHHKLYMDLLDQFDDRVLWREVFRASYACAIRMLNSESTMSASSERTQLKNMGSWLGSLTLARNRAVKYRNISFKDLLIEAHNTERLLVAIPFICKVLAMAAESVVFAPPCAWTMEILQILIELYQFGELKLNLKFEIEVLCTALDIDYKEVEPSTVIRSAPYSDEDMLPTSMPEGLEAFNDLSLINLSRARQMTERFSPSNMVPELADLQSMLKHNYTLPPGSPGLHNRIRQLLGMAAERAVSEIIGPVVERSVTIAAISTSQLIAKDFALEPDAVRYEASAHNAVKQLAGSLAGVTCKEPLRASMQNNIMLLRGDVPEQALPQGSVLMFVNDNLDVVCNIVQTAAENASVGEIDAQIEEPVQARKTSTFVEPHISPWASYIPEPYRPAPGGLNRDQLAIYTEFGRNLRGSATHNNNVSQDSGRQVPDVLQDQFSSMTNIQTPSEAPMLPNPNHHQPGQHSRTPVNQQLVNGYPDLQGLRAQIQDAVQTLYQALRDAVEDGRDQLLEVPSVQEGWRRLRSILTAAGPNYTDDAAFECAGQVVQLFTSEPESPPISEYLAGLLGKLCIVSERTHRGIHEWSNMLMSQRPSKTTLIVAALKTGLIDVRRVDLIVAQELQNRDQNAVIFLSQVADGILLNDKPSALRTDLVNSMTELTRWMTEAGETADGLVLLRKLQDTSAEPGSPVLDPASAKEAQIDYVFREWVRLQQNTALETTDIAFVHQLYTRQLLSNREDSAVFLRVCIQASLVAYEEQENMQKGSIDDAYLKVDALAKLVVLLVTHHGKRNNAALGKSEYFEDLLTLLVLIFAQQYQKKGERFNSKLFFRLFSSIMHEIHSPNVKALTAPRDMLHVIGKALMQLRPQYFPGFAFHWLSLHAHRLFMPPLLRSDDLGSLMYCDLLELQMAYVGQLLTPLDLSYTAKDYYTGVLKLLLVLHHDYPDFLAEHHFQILQHIPTHCTQMRSLVVSACPVTVHDLPDPFTDGLKVDRIEDMKRSPTVRGDTDSILINAGIYTPVDEVLNGNGDADQLDRIVRAVAIPTGTESGVAPTMVRIDIALLNALVLHVVRHAETHLYNTQRTLTFSATSYHAAFLLDLMEKLNPEGRYHFISAIANQLRYPSTHTHFFMYALLHLFRAGQMDQLSLQIQQQITRVFCERIVVHRPHPWGLMVTLIELLKNRTYKFWELPFVKDVPELERMLGPLLQHAGPSARGLV